MRTCLAFSINFLSLYFIVAFSLPASENCSLIETTVLYGLALSLPMYQTSVIALISVSCGFGFQKGVFGKGKRITRWHPLSWY